MTDLSVFLNTPVNAVSKMGVRPKSGDLFGVELECEGRRVDLGNSDPVAGWVPHRDGSLRDNHGQACEWVFDGPVNYKKSVERINVLFDFFTARKAKLVCSNRTSTHVHFNVGDKKSYQVVNLFVLFTIFEDILGRYCGEDRRGNLFCLSSRHAEEQVKWMERAVLDRKSFAIFKENWRYCSLNMASINKFGTVEFRSMRGLSSREEVGAWLYILKELCDYACYSMRNPADLIEEISVKTPVGFIKDVFSEKNVALLLGGLDDDEINSSIYEGLRLVQVLCYRVGAEFSEVNVVGKDFWAELAEETKKPEDYIEKEWEVRVDQHLEGLRKVRIAPREVVVAEPGVIVPMNAAEFNAMNFDDPFFRPKPER